LNDYYSVAKTSITETIVKKSRFICYLQPVQSGEEGQVFIDRLRKKHWDARHNVWAWRVGFPVPTERFSDDGEPAGTAGMPVLEVLRKKQLINAVVVVTRYFGGILLGAGGLVRAYTDSVVQGLNDAGIMGYCSYQGFRVAVDYPLYGMLSNKLEDINVIIEPPQFGADVTVNGWVPSVEKGKLEKIVAELSNGQVKVEWGEKKYFVN
jgi:uncharacterized YigZ family protein